MKKSVGVLTVLFLVSFVSGCYNARINNGDSFPTRSAEFVQDWHNNFVFGLVPGGMENVKDLCPNGIEAVNTYHSFLNSVVSALTLSMYSPVTVKIWCKGGKTSEVTVPLENLEELALSQPDNYRRFLADVEALAGDVEVLPAAR